MTDLGLTNNNETTPASSDANDPAALAATQLPSSPPTVMPVSGKGPAPRKAPVRKPKVAATKKAASGKVGVQLARPKKVTSAKKATAKKTPPLKAKPVKVVVAPPQVARPTVRRTESATSAQATASESARETAKAKTKLVRDSFTMPQQDFGLIAVLKDRALGFKRPAKKSELLRAGLHTLQQLTDTQLRGALDSLVPLKAGRPKKKTN